MKTKMYENLLLPGTSFNTSFDYVPECRILLSGLKSLTTGQKRTVDYNTCS